MANKKISDLPAAAAAAGANQFEINEAGTSKRLTNAQIATFIETALNLLTLVGGKIALNNDGSASFGTGACRFNADGSITFPGFVLDNAGNVNMSGGVILLNNDGSATFTGGVVFGNAPPVSGGAIIALDGTITVYNGGGGIAATIFPSGDIQITDLNRGLILADRANGNNYRLVCTNGIVTTEVFP